LGIERNKRIEYRPERWDNLVPDPGDMFDVLIGVSGPLPLRCDVIRDRVAPNGLRGFRFRGPVD
jgi:hypothetical protein